jgi:hypothetical protein
MDITKLKLTLQELREITHGYPENPLEKEYGYVADAQLARGLWGIVEWLRTVPEYGGARSECVSGAAAELARFLEQAGFPSPFKSSDP